MRRQVEAEQLRHVLDLRQVGQIVQAEAIEELARGAVQKRAADHLLAADDLDQMPFDQRAEHAGRVDAANLGNLRRGHRLLVGDHRQRLERRHRQLLRRPLVEQAAHPLVELGARHDLIAAGDLDERQSALRADSPAFSASMAATMSSFGSVSSSLVSVLIVTGSGDAKISASTIDFSSDMTTHIVASLLTSDLTSDF